MLSEESLVIVNHTTRYWPMRCMSYKFIQTQGLVHCLGSGTFIVPLKADPQAPAVLVSITMMIIHSCQIRMLGQMTMLRGQQLLKNACVQLKLGVGTDSPSHYWPRPMAMVTSLQCYVRRQPHVLTYTEICCSVKNLPLTPVKTSHEDGLYPRIFQVFYLMLFFSTSLFENIKKWSCLDTVSILFIHGRAMLAIEDKSVLPMHIRTALHTLVW